MDVDVAIIGGGPAGLSAALYLGRARRRVVVIDAGQPRHAVSPSVHNFLTREGMTPAELRRVAWEQLASFAVEPLKATVESLEWTGSAWSVRSAAGTVTAKAVLLAMGVQDVLPAWPGLRERWGQSVHFCPYCHGWEVRDQALATTGHGEHTLRFAPLLTQWSSDVVVIDNALTPEDTEALQGHGITVQSGQIAALEGPGTELDSIVLTDGTRLSRSALFLMASQRQVPLVRSLNVNTTDFPSNPDGLVTTDEQQKTSLPMLWAAGDIASPAPQVLEAAASGGRAAVSIHMTLALGSQ